MKEQCTPKNTCGMNKRVLDADSNEPPLASIRDREPSQKDDTRRHVISNFVLPGNTFVWCSHCHNDSSSPSVCDKDDRRTDGSEASLHNSPIEQRLRNAWFPRKWYKRISCHIMCVESVNVGISPVEMHISE